MKIEMKRELIFRDQGGVSVTVDLNSLNLTAVQNQTLSKFTSDSGLTLSSMSASERDILKDLKASIKGGSGPVAGIVRFDWKWVSID